MDEQINLFGIILVFESCDGYFNVSMRNVIKVLIQQPCRNSRCFAHMGLRQRFVHWVLFRETMFDFHGYEGRELHIKVNPKIALRMRMTLVDRRLYQWQVVCAQGNVWSTKAGEFFERFSVVGLEKRKS